MSKTRKLKPGPICGVCPLYHTCRAICDPVEQLLPSMERGRIDAEDLPRLHLGMRLTNALLDNERILTRRQRAIVRLYYRESLLQSAIAERLGISQQAVNDSLARARITVGKHVKGLLTAVLAEDGVLAEGEELLQEHLVKQAPTTAGRTRYAGRVSRNRSE